MKNNLVFNVEHKLERISPNLGVFSTDLMVSTRFFAHPVIASFLPRLGNTGERIT